MLAIGKPERRVLCAVCQRQVDHWQMHDSVGAYVSTVAVQCHGKKDTLLFRDYVPATVIAFQQEAEALAELRKVAAPADHFICLSLLLTGQHKHLADTLSNMDVIAGRIATEEL